MNLLINVREYGSAYIATALSGKHRKQASCTSNAERAAEAVVIKVLGNHRGDEPRLTRLNETQFMGDVTKLEGFETVNTGLCYRCYAEHRIMFKRRRRTWCTGCAVRVRATEDRRAT